MLEPLVAGIVDHVIGLTSSGQIQYVVVGDTFNFICGAPSRLYACNTYRNILIILIISDTGKISVVRSFDC